MRKTMQTSTTRMIYSQVRTIHKWQPLNEFEHDVKISSKVDLISALTPSPHSGKNALISSIKLTCNFTYSALNLNFMAYHLHLNGYIGQTLVKLTRMLLGTPQRTDAIRGARLR